MGRIDAVEQALWLCVSAVSAALAWLTAALPLALFGVSFAFVFAGFSGAVLALAFLPPMPRSKMFVAVFVGTLAAAWGVLPVTEMLTLSELYPGISFAIGLLAYGAFSWFFKSGGDALARRIGGGP